MNAHRRTRRPRRAFTLVELLIVISIMAILAGILIPTIAIVRGEAKKAATKALISLISNAAVSFENDHGYYPPDAIEATTQLYHFSQPDLTALTTGDPLTAAQVPPQALYYYLGNGFTGQNAPYATFAKNTQAHHFDTVFTERLPVVVDPWGRPIIYVRKPRGNTGNFKSGAGGVGGSAYKPRHDVDAFDVFSVGPDGQTGGNDLPKSPLDTQLTLISFCQNALNQDIDGEADDDIASWTKTN